MADSRTPHPFLTLDPLQPCFLSYSSFSCPGGAHVLRVLHVLRDMLHQFVYLNDILIFFPDEKTHYLHIHQVLQ